MWKLPALLGNEVVDYQVEVKGLRHREGTREVVQFDVASFNTDKNTLSAAISQGLGIMIVVVNKFTQEDFGSSVALGVPYNITVRALNLAGCGEEQKIYCFTQEGGSYCLLH